MRADRREEETQEEWSQENELSKSERTVKKEQGAARTKAMQHWLNKVRPKAA